MRLLYCPSRWRQFVSKHSTHTRILSLSLFYLVLLHMSSFVSIIIIIVKPILQAVNYESIRLGNQDKLLCLPSWLYKSDLKSFITRLSFFYGNRSFYIAVNCALTKLTEFLNSNFMDLSHTHTILAKQYKNIAQHSLPFALNLYFQCSRSNSFIL